MVRHWMFLCLFATAAISFTGCGPKTGTTVVEQPPTSEAEQAAYEEEMNKPPQYEK